MWSYSSLLGGPSIPLCSTQRSSMEEWSKERQFASLRQALEHALSGRLRILRISVTSRPAFGREGREKGDACSVRMSGSVGGGKG